LRSNPSGWNQLQGITQRRYLCEFSEQGDALGLTQPAKMGMISRDPAVDADGSAEE
jgi:hypothetical protein